MKRLRINFNKKTSVQTIKLNSSKSESNRLLIIQALSDDKIEIENLSIANDTILLQKLIEKPPENNWNIEDAGTSMRFLTSYLALTKEGSSVTGTERMKKRPIKILVNALRELGSKISYLQEDGYPPIKINKKINQKKNYLNIRGNISSQYISSLLMIAPKLKDGLKINVENPFYSKPYVLMTLKIMKKFGIKSYINNNLIKIKSQKYSGGKYIIEADWSAASYWYSILSINKTIDQIKLEGLRKKSFQGDQIISKIMLLFGVITEYVKDGIIIKKYNSEINSIELDFKDCPDLVQTVLVIAAYNKVKLKVYGVESLKIKETDRLKAMKKELNKIGCKFYNNGKSWILDKRKMELPSSLTIDTYKDHRMAMAFAPLSSEVDLYINDPNVVNKSYPTFWNDLKRVGYKII